MNLLLSAITILSAISGSGDMESNEEVDRFKHRMESLKPMEKRTAQAFVETGIHQRFVWPVENESKDDSNNRRKMNSKVLEAAKKALKRKMVCNNH